LVTYGYNHLNLNYNYQLASGIYSLLKFGSPEFSHFLHNNGYSYLGKNYKLFTFSLRFENISIENNRIKLLSPYAKLIISSPIIEDFIKNFVIGTFEQQKIELSIGGEVTEFKILQMELLPEPKFTDSMKFILLSPLVLSTGRENDGKMVQYYLRPSDIKEINRILTKNLKNKYAIVNNKEIATDELQLEWDENYLRKKRRITKKVTINKAGIYPIDVIGIQAPFTLKGSPELIKTGYQCGFGEKNSMGFGMAEVVNGRSN